MIWVSALGIFGVALTWYALWRAWKTETKPVDPTCAAESEDCDGGPLPDCPSHFCLIHHSAYCRRTHGEGTTQ